MNRHAKGKGTIAYMVNTLNRTGTDRLAERLQAIQTPRTQKTLIKCKKCDAEATMKVKRTPLCDIHYQEWWNSLSVEE